MNLADFQVDASISVLTVFPTALKPETGGMERHPAILMNQRRVHGQVITIAIFTMPCPIFDVWMEACPRMKSAASLPISSLPRGTASTRGAGRIFPSFPAFLTHFF
jgi:hypothetical protein